jgi:metal-sulfur cluster biosynthetic enzyme
MSEQTTPPATPSTPATPAAPGYPAAPAPAPGPAAGATPGAAAAPSAIGIATGTTTDGSVATPDEMRDAMKEVFDPEIPINIVDLGLIYKLEENAGQVAIDMTLTSPHCPVGDQLKARVVEVVTRCKGVKGVNVNLTFLPPWTKEHMTFEGKLQASMLGIM